MYDKWYICERAAAYNTYITNLVPLNFTRTWSAFNFYLRKTKKTCQEVSMSCEPCSLLEHDKKTTSQHKVPPPSRPRVGQLMHYTIYEGMNSRAQEAFCLKWEAASSRSYKTTYRNMWHISFHQGDYTFN